MTFTFSRDILCIVFLHVPLFSLKICSVTLPFPVAHLISLCHPPQYRVSGDCHLVHARVLNCHSLSTPESLSYGTPVRGQPIVREQWESKGGQMRGRGCERSVSLLFLKIYVCVLTFSYHFFSRSPTITEVFHNHRHGFLF
jgi:hypothetical protein